MNQGLPTLEGFLQFVRGYMGVPVTAIADDSLVIEEVYSLALEWSNISGYRSILITQPTTYRMLVYNLGASFLINYANDVTDSTYFADLRKSLGLGRMVTGFVNSAADQGTSQATTTLDVLQGLSLADLQLMQDPYGRRALAILMELGPLWGLS